MSSIPIAGLPLANAAARAPDATRHARLAPVAALALAALYLVTRSRIHTWDSIAYAARAAGDPLLADRYFSSNLFHPHHLLYAPLALAAHGALAPLGLTSDPFLPLQILNAALGGLCAWLAGVLARRLGADGRRALWVTLAVGASNAVWRFSTEVLVMIPSLAFLLLAACAAAGARSRAQWLAAGVALAGAMLIHQSAVVFAAAASLALLLVGSAGRLPAGAALAFTLGWVIPAGGAYLAIGIAETGGTSPAAIAGWMASAGHRATSFHLPLLTVLKEMAGALAEAWVTLTPLRRLSGVHGVDPRTGVEALATLVGLAGVAATALATLPRLARAVRLREPAIAMLIAGGLANAGLITGFQPWNHAYWVFVPALGGALIGARMPPLPGWARRAVPLLIVAVAAVNLVARALPATDPARAPYADLIAFARDHFRPGDRLVCGGASSPIAEGVIALPFFARVSVVLAPTPGRQDEALRFERRVDETFAERASGTSVFATSDVLTPLARVHPGLASEPVGTLRGLTVYRISGRITGRLTGAPAATQASR